MKPLENAEPIPMTRKHAREIAKASGVSVGEVRRTEKDEHKNATIWLNDVYQVSRRILNHDQFGDVVWLSIKRIDREPVTDWRDKQEIKNQLVGPECEGIELYPAESRLVDTANQFHLWCLADTSLRLPFGFNEGRQVSSIEAGNSKQRAI